jgi:hypothetical protein
MMANLESKSKKLKTMSVLSDGSNSTGASSSLDILKKIYDEIMTPVSVSTKADPRISQFHNRYYIKEFDASTMPRQE